MTYFKLTQRSMGYFQSLPKGESQMTACCVKFPRFSALNLQKIALPEAICALADAVFLNYMVLELHNNSLASNFLSSFIKVSSALLIITYKTNNHNKKSR